jgi:hypothetical protein
VKSEKSRVFIMFRNSFFLHFYIFLIILKISSNKTTKKKVISIVITTSTTTKITKLLTTDKEIPVCIGGFSLASNGITICNKDSSGVARRANEVINMIENIILKL